MEVTVRELKAHLSAIVRRVQAGETVLITSHRKPVARLVPPPPSGDSITDRLLAAGVISERPSGELPQFRSVPLPPGVPDVASAVIEDRG